MNSHKSRITLLLAIFAALSSASVQAQDMPSSPPDPGAPAAAAAPPVFTQPQLEQLVAPIALYPDPLIGQVLMASTYPLEVVEASRWLQTPPNAQLSGDQLAGALDQQPWDPSVKSLVAVPQVLKMMNDNLQWTEQLGDAFLAQQPAVMDSVQQLRQRAQTVGNLRSTPQQIVTTQGPAIVIEQANPEVVYVPVYNPYTVYGAWAYPNYRPYSFYPANYAWGAAVIGFGVGFAVAESVWGWDNWDWRHHRIDIDEHRFADLNHGRPPIGGDRWEHDPAHRQGVPYRDVATRARFQGASAPSAQRGFRGYAETGTHAAAPAFNAKSSLRMAPQPEHAAGKSCAEFCRASPAATGAASGSAAARSCGCGSCASGGARV